MSNLIVVAFNNPADAFEMRAALAKMQAQYLIEMEDAVVVTRDEKGAVMPWERIAQTFPQHWFNLRMCGTGPFQFDGFEPRAYVILRGRDLLPEILNGDDAVTSTAIHPTRRPPSRRPASPR